MENQLSSIARDLDAIEVRLGDIHSVIDTQAGRYIPVDAGRNVTILRTDGANLSLPVLAYRSDQLGYLDPMVPAPTGTGHQRSGRLVPARELGTVVWE